MYHPTIVTASAGFTRPADTTAYASGDLVANSTTAGSVTPLSFTPAVNGLVSLRVRRVQIYKTNTGVTNAAFRLHLYTASPTVSNGDNGALVSTQHTTYLGSIDVTVGLAFAAAASGWGAAAVNAELVTRVTSDPTLYGLLEARAAYTPGNAEVITTIIECEMF